MLSSLGITESDILDVLETKDVIAVEDDETYDELLTLKPTLSTMTACGNIGGTIDVHTVIESTSIIPYWSLSNGIIRVEGYARDDPSKWVYRGICRKYLIRKHTGKGPFKNAATFYIRIYDSEIDEYKEPSVKVFHNGGFQITGIRTPECMTEVINILVSAIKDTPGGFVDTTEGKAFQEICMMNADIDTGYILSRKAIQSLIASTTGIRSTFESTAYQGVNIKYYWNAGRNERGDYQDGVCPCDEQCMSSGKKMSIRNSTMNARTKCTKVTIAPFQTGKIIITGAKHFKQIQDAAKWILSFIRDNHVDIIGKPAKAKDRKKIPDPMRKSYPFTTSVTGVYCV